MCPYLFILSHRDTETINEILKIHLNKSGLWVVIEVWFLFKKTWFLVFPEIKFVNLFILLIWDSKCTYSKYTERLSVEVKATWHCKKARKPTLVTTRSHIHAVNALECLDPGQFDVIIFALYPQSRYLLSACYVALWPMKWDQETSQEQKGKYEE